MKTLPAALFFFVVYYALCVLSLPLRVLQNFIQVMCTSDDL